MKKLLVLVLFIVVIVVGAKVALQLYTNKTLGLNSPTIIMIDKGSSLTRVAQSLSEKGIIQYPRLFVKVGQFYGYESIKYGEYELKPSETYMEVLKKIVSGDNYKYEITFIEGEHMYRYAEQLEASGLTTREKFLNLVRNQKFIMSLLGEALPSLEGYLFPETYHFSKVDGVRVIVSTMVKNFLEETKDINFQNTGLSRHETITLASIVEKETGAPFERPLISSVFHNRMKKRMRLQTDPTIIYGILDSTGKEPKNIRKKDITARTSYNTYVISGLPPGPIGNPGIESIRAAIKPAESEFLYFVSQNDGTHKFTKSYKAHLKAVEKFQLDPKMREGKSWRDLKKRNAHQ